MAHASFKMVGSLEKSKINGTDVLPVRKFQVEISINNHCQLPAKGYQPQKENNINYYTVPFKN